MKYILLSIGAPACFSEAFCLYNCETQRFIVYTRNTWGHPRVTTKNDIQATESCRFCYATASVAGYELLIAMDAVNSVTGQQRVLYHDGHSRQAHVQSYRNIEGDRFVQMSGQTAHRLVPHSAPTKMLVVDGSQLILGDSSSDLAFQATAAGDFADTIP